MDPTYRFLSEDEIRLITVALEGESLSLELKTYLRTAAPSYDALSYCWGEDTSTTIIECNGAPLSLRNSLAKALPQIHVHRPDPKRPLWIDALCLDQRNENEKALHVPLMHEIYVSAARTIIWLGEASDSSNSAMEVITDITERVCQMKRLQSLSVRQNLMNAGLPPLDNQQWLSIRELQMRPWFYRLWTLQEIVLSQEAVILCGNKNVSWDTLRRLYDAAIEKGLAFALDPEVKDHAFGGAGYLMRHTNFLRQCRASKRDVALPILLTLSADRGYSVSVDRLWALLGMLNKKYRRMIREEVSIDYHEDAVLKYHQTFLEVMRFHIKHDRGIAMQLIEDNLRTWRNPELPSWCPDWHTNVGGVPLSRQPEARAGFPGGRMRYVGAFMRLNSDHSIELCGLPMDTVEHVSKTPGHDLLNAKSSPWLHDCLEIIRKYGDFPRFDVYPEVLCIPEVPPPPPDLVYTEQGRQHKLAQEILIYVLYPSDIVAKDARHLGRCEGRKFFSTKAGRFGIGPEGLAEGDLLCVMYGASTVWALRPTDSRSHVGGGTHIEGSEFELVGCAYTPSLWRGQAWDKTSCESMRRFRLR